MKHPVFSLLVGSLIAISSVHFLCAAESAVPSSVDWPTFMAKNDLLWKKLPTAWYNAPFLGNGMLGAVVRKTGANVLQWDIGRADVQDHRDGQNGKMNPLYDRCRFAIGNFALTTIGKITGCDWRLDLWNAELRGTVTTSKGTINIRSYIPARGDMVIIAEITVSEGERGASWKWTPTPAISPRYLNHHEKLGSEILAYPLNPPPIEETRGDIHVCVQKLQHGEFATAWKITNHDLTQRLVVSVAQSFPEQTADAAAPHSVQQAEAKSDAVLTKENRDWWHAWYPRTFLSVPDEYWTAFYWIQMYKLASGTRPDGVVLDLQGPWEVANTPWPGTWWNLNTELTYWPTYAGNRLDIAQSLSANLLKYRENLINNVPPEWRSDSAGIGRASGLEMACPMDIEGKSKVYEVGSLQWVCDNLWLQYRMTMDDQFLRDDVYPLLRRTTNYYFHIAINGKDGEIHLPKTFSPEYGSAPDCNYDLALFKWGCKTLLWINSRLKLNDPLTAKWQDVMNRLTAFPQNEHGFMIGAGVPFAHTHRHFSHLFMVFPLHLMNTEDPATKGLVEKSVQWWHSLKGGLQGYSYTGGSSLLATIGDADGAYEMLNGLRHYLQPNTMYHESGPVIETPLSGADSIQNMLLQSWGGIVRVFPATPKEWNNATFANLRAEGAFLVSAERKNGKPAWVAIKSLAGEPLELRAGFSDAAKISGVPQNAVKKLANGDLQITLPKGAEIVISEPGVTPKIAPVVSTDHKMNPFGMQ